MPESMLWFTLVFLVLLKIPLLYLCYVVWWAVKDPPAPGEGLEDAGVEPGFGPEPESGSWWKRRLPRHPTRRGPHGSPARRPAVAPTRARSRAPL
jgi:hypothetical protein